MKKRGINTIISAVLVCGMMAANMPTSEIAYAATNSNTVKKATVNSIKVSSKKKLTIKWKKLKDVTAYQVVVSKKKSGKSVVFKKTTKKTKVTTKKMKAGTYYVKVRAYKLVDGNKVYGKYSKVKKVTVTDVTALSNETEVTKASENVTTEQATTANAQSGTNSATEQATTDNKSAESDTTASASEQPTGFNGQEPPTGMEPPSGFNGQEPPTGMEPPSGFEGQEPPTGMEMPSDIEDVDPSIKEEATKPENTEIKVEEETKTVSESDVDVTVDFEDESAEYTGVTVEENAENSVKKVTVSQAGTYEFTGKTENTVIEVAKGIKGEVELVLNNLEIDNTEYADKTGKDSPVISIGKDTSVEVILQGENTLTGSDKFVTAPEAIISQKGTSAVLTIVSAGDGVLNVIDKMSKTTEFGDNDPADGISTKGELVIKSGTINVKVNGDALKGTGNSGAGGITVENGTINVESYLSNGLKSKSGNITINGGTVNLNYTADDAINAKNYNVTINGGTVNVTNCYGDGIQGNWVIINGGYTNITTNFENAGLNYYNTSLPVYNSMTVSESGNSKTKKETVNIDTGSHKGIKAGKKAESYVYKAVSEGSEYVAGQTYTSEAEGGIKITGGTVVVDTTAVGIKYNGGGGNFQPGNNTQTGSNTTGNLAAANNDGQYIIGSPDDGIKSNNDFEISGGTVYVAASDDGISAAGKLTITGEAVVNVEQAYEGIEAAEIVVGEQVDNAEAESGYPYVSVYTNDDGINTSGKSSVSYVYEDESEEKYVKTSVSTMSGHNMTVNSGTVVVMIADDVTQTYSLEVKDGMGVLDNNSTFDGTFRANGDGIDCNGSFYAYGGAVVVWAAAGNDNSAIDTGDSGAEYVIADGAKVITLASTQGMTNNPTKLEENAVSYSNANISAGTAFAITDSNGNAVVAFKALKKVTNILYCGPGLSGDYTLTSGGSVSDKVNVNSVHDGRYGIYDGSGSTAVSTATASTTIQGGQGGFNPGGQAGPGGQGGLGTK
ncbi:MAG: carbohydrate-binding domain-containing protein [Lachnospiraceae bacterium]|nr:carbohydrate-binding domain-containing protein [Lachnospiraceae bacterium]